MKKIRKNVEKIRYLIVRFQFEMKFENLEDMSKCPGLIFQQNVLGLTNKQKICQNLKNKKKLSFGFREEKQGKTVKIREKLEKLEKKTQ